MVFLWVVLSFGMLGGLIAVIVSLFSPVRIDGILYRGIVGFFVFCVVGALVVFILRGSRILDIWMGEKGVRLDMLDGADSVGVIRDVLQKKEEKGESKLEEGERAPSEEMVMEYAEKHPEEVAKVLEEMSKGG